MQFSKKYTDSPKETKEAFIWIPVTTVVLGILVYSWFQLWVIPNDERRSRIIRCMSDQYEELPSTMSFSKDLDIEIYRFCAELTDRESFDG